MEKKIYSLVTALAVVLALMGVIFVVSQIETQEVVELGEFTSADILITVEDEVPRPSKRTNIVNEDYVRDLDADANLVVMTADGSAYALQSGNYLIADRLVTIDSTGKKVYYTKDPAKSVSTE